MAILDLDHVVEQLRRRSPGELDDLLRSAARDHRLHAVVLSYLEARCGDWVTVLARELERASISVGSTGPRRTEPCWPPRSLAWCSR